LPSLEWAEMGLLESMCTTGQKQTNDAVP
jgi:hypothetical protein